MSSTLAEELTAACRRWEGERAVLDGSSTVTYGELLAASDRLVGTYRELGIVPGDRIVCQLPNGPLHLIVAAATWRYGGVHVVADRDLTVGETAGRVRDVDAAALVLHGGPEGAATVAALRGACPGLRIVSEGEPVGDVSTSLSQLLGGDGGTAPPAVRSGPSPDDPALVLFTSGSTGRAKGVVRYHGQLVDQWQLSSAVMQIHPRDVHLVQLPLSHGFGLGMAIMGLMSGGTLVTMEAFSAEPALMTIAAHGVTVLHGTPAHFTLLTDHLDPARHDVSSLRIGQGSAGGFSPDLLARVFHELGMDVMLLYGCSEGLNCFAIDRDDVLRGSVGRPSRDRVQVFVEGRPAEPDEVGEIAFRRTHRFRYWGDGEDLPSEWHPPGDLGRYDSDGRLYVLGRARYQINRGGLKITPEEVESRLGRYPGLADCAVVAVADPVVGERVCACVVPQPGVVPTLAGIRAFLGDSLARHKLPEELCILDTIPKVKLGKVDRAELGRIAGAAGREKLDPRTGASRRSAQP